MIYRSLTYPSTHAKLFWKYKFDNENLGLAKLDKSKTFFDELDSVKGQISQFLSRGLHLDFPTDCFDTGNVKNYQKDYQWPIERYCKLVWLTHDYIKNKQLENPVGAHWDTLINKWIIHPGGSRQHIIQLFYKDTFEALAFNTGGKEIKFDKIFLSEEKLNNYYNTTQLHMVVVADQGSLIPHVHFNTNQYIINSVEYYHMHLKKFFNTYKLIANFDLLSFDYIAPKKSKHTIKITLDSPQDIVQQIKALCIVPNFHAFNDYGVRIERT